MKAIITLLVLGGLVLGGIYMFGGYRDFDPDKQGNEARAAIKPGMSLHQVVLKAGSNPRYQAINRMETKRGGHTVSEVRIGSPVAFDEKKVEQRIKDKMVPEGFVLTYNYSERVAFAVQFDGEGKVTDINDVTTMADLLQTR